MTDRPFFSVLIPSYNRPEFVGLAVESVLASDFRDFELIVSDDCSPRRNEISAALEKHKGDPRLRFYSQPTNLREPANRAIPDLNGRELAVLLPLVALILWLGFYPKPFLDRMAPAANGVLMAAREVRRLPELPSPTDAGAVGRGVTMAGER